MQNSLVSIVIPVYNVEKFLRRCLDSVINQTYRNLEIILIDDGSIDNSPIICDDYALKDNRVKVIHKKNGGLSEARNLGLSIATGFYIMFVDSDDWLEGNAVEILVARMEKDNEADMCCFEMAKTDGISFMALRNNPNIESIKGRDSIVKDVCLGLNIKSSACCKIYKHSFIIDNNLRFIVGVINEDTIFIQTAALYAQKVIFENSILYNIYSNDLSISRDIKERNFTSLFAVLKYVKESYNKAGYLYNYDMYIYGGWIKLCLYTLVQAAYRLKWNKFIRYYLLLNNSDYSNVKIGNNIELFSRKMKYIYRISLYPYIFYMLIRILKLLGYKMQ